MKIPGFVWLLGLALPALTVGCGKTEPPAVGNSGAPHPHPHQHVAPHGGTPVELGKEEFHLEFVLDDHAGKLSAYVLDGEMEKFIRVPAPGFTVSAKLSDRVETLNFKAVPNTATGETIGELPLATGSDLDHALETAARGYRLWRARSTSERSAVLAGAARLLRERRDTIAQIATLEEGKTLAESKIEVQMAANLFDFAAVENHDPVSERHSFDLIVSDVNHRGIERLM